MRHLSVLYSIAAITTETPHIQKKDNKDLKLKFYPNCDRNLSIFNEDKIVEIGENVSSYFYKTIFNLVR